MQYARLGSLNLTVLCITITAYCCWGLDVISSSKLEKCIRDGTQANDTSTALSCLQKLVVTVTVDSGDSLDSQNIDFSISCIGSSTGSCPCPCNYVLDSSCTCRDLASSLTVTLTKGPLWSSYPLQYLQSFNYKPYEAIVRPGAGQCRDGDLDTAPTCGWYYSAGVRVPDSQGFTCSCDASQVWDDTFGTNKERTRGNLDCDFFSNPLDILIGRLPCSAHCLMMDPHWYGGYSLGEASLQFIITAALSYSTNSGSSSESITISPVVPTALSANQTLSAKLLGDLAGYTQLPVLSEKVLMIPHPQAGQTVSDVFANRTEWMLMDRSEISFDGSECDKIGTSFTAFRFQPSGCKRAPQVCLTNQLKDVLEADQARIAQGRVPLYLVSQYTNGLDSQLKSFAGGPLSFALPVTGIRSSVVQLETVADNIKLIVNVSPGKILAARMCTFAATSCGGFEATASRGYLQAWLSNLGTLDATYTVIVSNCSVSVTAVPAQRVGIPAKGNGTIAPFQIFVEDDTAVANRYCWLTMLDSKGAVTDRVEVPFFTNATKYEEWPTGGLDNNGTGPGTLDNATCDTACSSKWSLVCQIRHGCWGKVGSIFGLLFGTIGGSVLLGMLAMKFGLLTTLLQLCGGGAGGGSGLLSCCGAGNNSSKESQGKSSQSRRKRYEIEDRDSASGSQGERRGRRSDRSTASGRYSSHRRSQSHSSTYSSKYDVSYDNQLFDKPQQPPSTQRIGRSSSRTTQDGEQAGRSHRQGSRRVSRHPSGAHSADDQLQQQQQNNHNHYLKQEGAYLNDNGQQVSNNHLYEADYAESFHHQTGMSSSNGKKHKGDSRNSQMSAVPWDESAAGGVHLPRYTAGRGMRGKHDDGEYAGSSGDDAAYQGTFTGHEFELKFPDASALVSRSSPGLQNSGSLPQSSKLVSNRLPLAAASSPGRLPAAAAAAAAAARRPVQHQVRGTTRLSELVRSAQSASEALSAESEEEEMHHQQQQQQALYMQPARAATMPGSLSAAAAAAAAASSSRDYRSSVSPSVRGRNRHSQAAKSPAVLRRSRENSGDSITLQSGFLSQQQQQQLGEEDGMEVRINGSSSSRGGERGSRSQPPGTRHGQLAGSDSDNVVSEESYHPDHYHQQQQYQQQQQQQQMSSGHGILRGSALVRRHSAVGGLRTQQQQQPPQVVLAGCRPGSATARSSSALQKSTAGAAGQQQSGTAGRQAVAAMNTRYTATSAAVSPDEFFAPYDHDDDDNDHDDDDNLPDENNESDAYDGGMNLTSASIPARQTIPQQQQALSQARGPKSSSRQLSLQQQVQQDGHWSGSHRRSSSSPTQQQQQQQQLPLRGGSAPGHASTASRQPSPFSQQQQQQPVSKWVVMSGPLSTAARPHLAPFHDSTGDADTAPLVQAAAATAAVGRNPQSHIKMVDHSRQHQHQQGSITSRQASASIAAGPSYSSAGTRADTLPTEPGSIGRHQQQTKALHSPRMSHASPVHQEQQQQQQRPSVVSLASRVPGFVRSAAVGLSNSGGSPSSSGTNGQGRRHPQ